VGRGRVGSSCLGVGRQIIGGHGGPQQGPGETLELEQFELEATKARAPAADMRLVKVPRPALLSRSQSAMGPRAAAPAVPPRRRTQETLSTLFIFNSTILNQYFNRLH
jgi:hypothetical protein